jgi:hypothetical protein
MQSEFDEIGRIMHSEEDRLKEPDSAKKIDEIDIEKQ